MKALCVFLLAAHVEQSIGSELLVTPDGIICKLASIETVEDHTVNKVCMAIHSRHAEIPLASCEVAVKTSWDVLLKKCPKSNATEVDRELEPGKIEKLVCEVASVKRVEDAVADGLCKEIHAKHAEIPLASCEAAVEKVWEVLRKKCPKSNFTEVDRELEPGKIEKLVCEVASVKRVEDAVADGLCKEIHAKHAEIPLASCEAAVEKVWEVLRKKCSPDFGEQVVVV
eukprot:TRINITY_DN2132_c0_g1_i4.p1 TRINITY_DN2132_c0_g1~~TRINITY_DN2132_c0_g1_i4.p1  ORF type:complete len:227 (+),score=68.27 TRINITY_DN2132_c0_g1_i4:76-756(+)